MTSGIISRALADGYIWHCTLLSLWYDCSILFQIAHCGVHSSQKLNRSTIVEKRIEQKLDSDSRIPTRLGPRFYLPLSNTTSLVHIEENPHMRGAECHSLVS